MHFKSLVFEKWGVKYRHQLVKYILPLPSIQIIGVKYRKKGGGQVFGILDLLCPTDDTSPNRHGQIFYSMFAFMHATVKFLLDDIIMVFFVSFIIFVEPNT